MYICFCKPFFLREIKNEYNQSNFLSAASHIQKFLNSEKLNIIKEIFLTPWVISTVPNLQSYSL